MKKERKLFNWLSITLIVIIVILIAAIATIITLALITTNDVMENVNQTQINWKEQWDAFANANPKKALKIAMMLNMLLQGLNPWA